MAPIIETREKVSRSNASLRLSDKLQERLRKFSIFKNVSTTEIVEKSLEHVINSDREFCQKESGIQVKDFPARVPKKKPERAA